MNKDRIAIIIGTANGQRVMVSNESTVTITTGLAQPSLVVPYVIHAKEYGRIVEDAWFAIAAAGTPTFVFGEVLLGRSIKELVDV